LIASLRACSGLSPSSTYHGFGYGLVFGLVSTFHVIAFLVIISAVRKVQPIEAEVL
jgi:hypothetical protein